MKTIALLVLASFLTLPAMADEPHDSGPGAEEHGTSERPQDPSKTLEDDVLSKLDDPELLEILRNDVEELQRLQMKERFGEMGLTTADQ